MEEYALPLQTPCVYYDPNFLPESEATEAYNELLKNTPWEKTAKINRWVALMELPKEDNITATANNDDNDDDDGNKEKEGTGYRYRDAPGAALIGFPSTVQKLKLLAEEWYNSKNNNNNKNNNTNTNSEKVEFNVCLLNYYQNGSQRIGWHSDREELGRTTPIASLSLGATRQFLLRSKTDGVRDRASIGMTNGSICIMENACQYRYLHSVPREGDVEEGRINLTFRCKRAGDGIGDGRGGNGGGVGVGGGDGTTAGELEHERRDHWVKEIELASEMGGAEDCTAGAWGRWNNNEGGDVNGTVTTATTTTTAPSDGQVFGDTVTFYHPSTHPDSASLSKRIDYVVKTNIGAESYCAAELQESLDTTIMNHGYEIIARPLGIAGYVAACFKNNHQRQRHENEKGEEEIMMNRESEMVGMLLQLRTAHHVLRYHGHFDLNDVLSHEDNDAENKDADDAAADNDVGNIDPAHADDANVAETSTEGKEQDGTTIPLTTGKITGEMLYSYYKQELVNKEAYVSSLVDLEAGGTFRVSCERIGGPHKFQAPEVER